MITRRAMLTTISATVAAGAIGPRRAFAADPIDSAAAKREGQVVWYTSNPIEHGQKVAKAFEAETGIPVEMFRSGGAAILRRFQQEMQAGRVACDVLTTADPAAVMSLAGKGTFVPFKPNNFDKIPATLTDPGGAFFAQRLNLITLLVRTDKVPAAQQPKSWADLIDPKFKGKLIIADPSFAGVQVTVVGMLARAKGWDYFAALRRNDTLVVQGQQQVLDLLKRGERLIGAGSIDAYGADARKEGHPVANIYPSDGTFAIPGPSAIVKGAPHPNAAKLFSEFLISDAVQRGIVEDGHFSPRIDMPGPAGAPALKDIKLLPIDYDAIEKQSAAIKRTFNETFQ